MHKSLLALAQFGALALALTLSLALWLYSCLSLLSSLSLSADIAAALASCLLHVSFVKKGPGILLSALLTAVRKGGKRAKSDDSASVPPVVHFW